MCCINSTAGQMAPCCRSRPVIAEPSLTSPPAFNTWSYETNILHEISAERRHQDAKWGSQRHLDDTYWATILGEEFGEACQDALEANPVGLREELIQVAAVAVAWIEALDYR